MPLMPQTVEILIITHSCNYIIVIYLVFNHKTVTICDQILENLPSTHK